MKYPKLLARLLVALLVLTTGAQAAQSTFVAGNFPTVSPYAGLTLVNNLNSAFGAYISSNSGASAPAYVTTGTLWANTSSNTLQFYNGSTSSPIGSFNGTQWIATSAGFQQIAITSTGSANAYVVTYSPAPTAYVTGQKYRFITNFSNTGASTVAVNGLAALPLKKYGATALASGDLGSGVAVECVYDGTNCEITSQITTNNLTATTQAAADNTTALASDQFAQNAAQYNGSGMVNKLRNASMDIAQRGTSGTASGAYTLDGWIIAVSGGSPTWSQTLAYVALPAGGIVNNAAKITGATSTTDVQFLQKIESFMSAPLAGRVVTFQITMVNNTGATLTPTFTTRYAGSADNWSSPVTDLSSVSLQACTNGSTCTESYTFTASASAKYGYMVLVDFGSSLNSASNNVTLTAADLRATPNATVGLNSNPPYPELRPTPIENVFCQRYYEIGNLQIQTYSNNVANALAQWQQFSTTKRSVPTITFSSTGYSFANSLSSANLNTNGFSATYNSAVGGNVASVSSLWQATSEL